jgi:O-antigen/teichoic acid export membrane protein
MKKQGLAGTVILYTGVLWGFINSTLLFPKILGASIFGFIQTLSFTNNLIITFVLLGLPGAVIRFYPYFKDEKKNQRLIFYLRFTHWRSGHYPGGYYSLLF